MADRELMRELVEALVDDTSRQLQLLAAAIREGDSQRCARLAHYSKGACANVGANRAAGIFKQMEKSAAAGEFARCAESLAGLEQEVGLLRSAAGTL